MYSSSSWNILGYDNKQVPNTFYETKTGNGFLAVVFPGFSYSSEAPLLFYIKEILIHNAHDILSVDFSYSRNPEFLSVDESTQTTWFQQDVTSVYEEVLRHPQYQQLLLVGKSMGTTAMYNLIRSGLKHENTCFIWITPGILHNEIAQTIRNLDKPSLILVGTADPYYDEKDYREIEHNSKTTMETFENAGHLLEIAQNVSMSIANLKRCAAVVDRFIKTLPSVPATGEAQQEQP